MQDTILNQVNLEQIMVFLGALGTIASLLATVLPKHWVFTQLLAKYFADTRGVRKVPEELKEKPKPIDTWRDDKTPIEPLTARRKSDPPPRSGL